MDAAQHIPEHLKPEFYQAIDEMQLRDQMMLFNKVGQACFNDCVNTFHGKSLAKDESKCIGACAAKFLNMSKRVGQRFAEINMQQQQEGVALQQPQQ